MRKRIKLMWAVCLTMLALEGFGQQNTENYVTTKVAREEVQSDLSAQNHQNQVQQSVQYLDGLGRPKQTVARWASPNGKDVVSFYEYDAQGRQLKQYLSYPTLATSGNLRVGPRNEQTIFYNGHFGGNAGQYAFAEQLLEKSPLDRVTVQGASGLTWQLGQGHEAIASQRANTASDAVKDLMVSTSDGNTIEVGTDFPANELWTSISQDQNRGANQGKTVEFTNKKGQVVLKKVKGDTGYLETYYVYDRLDRLRFVIPPAGVLEAKQNWGFVNDDGFRQKWMFCYEYDGLGRMVGKRVPGSGWMNMVYDQRDHVVLTQNANQRNRGIEVIDGNGMADRYEGFSYQLTNESTMTLKPGFEFSPANVEDGFEVTHNQLVARGEWIFTKYDEFNRPVMTGYYHSTKTREELQLELNGSNDGGISLDPNNSTLHPDIFLFSEVFVGGGGFSGYTNQAFPKNITGEDLLTVTYYDNYDFMGTTELQNELPSGATLNLKGQVTGILTRVLDSDQLLRTVTFYDARYRPLKIIADNHLAGRDVIENSYKNVVSPLVLETKMSHTSNAHTGILEITETYAYDHLDRLLTVDYLLKDDGVLKKDTRLLANQYNELGELSGKNLGSGVQQLDYLYNIRGWLTKINDGTALSGNDPFGMELHYDGADQYNGNIGKMTWRTLGGGTGSNQNGQSYNYIYDPLSRLKSASYTGINGAGLFDVNNLQYDANGNILSLTRKKNGLNLDLLTYQYHGNQLSAVEDGGNQIEGFVNGASQAEEYTYDANGNMVSDLNKGIANITYNHLNLPVLVTKSNGDYVRYTYDAAGIKLKKESNTGQNIQVTDYVADKHYENSVLSFFQHSEGRVIRNGNDYAFEYNLTDHLGNVRATLDANGNVVQRQDYYPFGLSFDEWTSTNPKNQYLYNQGKEGTTFQGDDSKYFATERQVELDLDMTKFRMYDYNLGRFMSIDPLADQAGQEIYTPYHYSLNNPVRYNDPYGDCVGDLPCPQSLKNVGEGLKAIGGDLKRVGNRVVDAIPDNVKEGFKAIGDDFVRASKRPSQALVAMGRFIDQFSEANTDGQLSSDRGGIEFNKTEGTSGNAASTGKPEKIEDITVLTEAKGIGPPAGPVNGTADLVKTTSTHLLDIINILMVDSNSTNQKENSSKSEADTKSPKVIESVKVREVWGRKVTVTTYE